MVSGRRLQCVYQHAPTPGAPGIYRHRLLLGELVRRGWHVDVVSTPINYMTGDVPPAYRGRRYVREEIDGIAHHWVWASGDIHASKRRRALNYATFAASAVARGARLPRPDVLLVSSPPLSVAPVGPVLAARHGCPWVLEVRDLWPESAVSVGWLEQESAAYRALSRIACGVTSRAHAVVVPTPGLVGPVLRQGAREVSVVTGAVRESPADGAARARVRRSLGIDDGSCVFLYLGSVGVANGLDGLLDAVERLPSTVDATFVVVGDGSARADLEAAVAARGLSRVRVLPAVPKGEADGLLAASDVCLHFLRPDPTFAYALPTKVLEYLGARRPFVTNVAGVPEFVARRSGGSYAATTDDLCTTFAAWADMTPAERRRRGEQAFAYGTERYALDVVVDRLEGLLLDCIANGRSPVRGASEPRVRGSA